MVANSMIKPEVLVQAEPLMVKVPKAAEMCGMSPAKLKVMVAAGRIPSVKLDGCRLIVVEDLREFVRNLSRDQHVAD